MADNDNNNYPFDTSKKNIPSWHAAKYSLERLKAHNLNLNKITKEELLKEKNMNISTFDELQSFNDLPLPQVSNTNDDIPKFENPLTLPIYILKNINNYRFIYTHLHQSLVGQFNDGTKKKVNRQVPRSEKEIRQAEEDANKQKEADDSSIEESSDKSSDTSAEKPKVSETKTITETVMDTSAEHIESVISDTAVTASLFNPLFNVQVLGLCENIPLIQDVNFQNYSSKYDKNIDDCSVKELVKQSHAKLSILGNARYRYADFMYCKDLGKIPNNHLITLRKFPYPVGDNIYRFSVQRKPASDESDYTFENTGDIARLVTWFGTEDNKLEDILKYEYKASWKELKSKIDEKQSKEDSESRGIMGTVANTMNPSYMKYFEQGLTGAGGTNNLHSKLASSIYKWGERKSNGLLSNFGINDPSTPQDNAEVLRNYDNNRVYTPKNTVQDTHIYEGKLTMSQEISLKFSYKMRGYDNINPKSAMLDLLGNILEVTYKRGEFWGGARKIIGPPPNVAGWNKAKHMVDGTWDKIGGIFNQLGNMNSFGEFFGAISGLAMGWLKAGWDKAKQALFGSGGGGGGIATKGWDMIKELMGKVGNAAAGPAKASLLNSLGRPAMYAFDSLLKGDNVGLWHLTIGNPKNPILSIGNLILTSASVTHSGPLGIDDFPTEVTVNVKVKPARSRDLTDITKMYTKGMQSLYMPLSNNAIKNFFPDTKNDFVELANNEAQNNSAENNSKSIDTEAYYFQGSMLPEIVVIADPEHHGEPPEWYDFAPTENEVNDLITDENAFVAWCNQVFPFTGNAIVKEIGPSSGSLYSAKEIDDAKNKANKNA